MKLRRPKLTLSRILRTHVAVAVALVSGIGLGALLPGAFGASTTAPTAIRSALAQTNRVQGAPNRTLVLSQVVVEPGAELALHHHLGTQIARVQSGVLRYTVRHGSVTVRRGESDQDPSVVRKIGAGQTGSVRAGEWIVEQPSDIHQAANRGTGPVVIYIATLLEKGAPPATPVASPSSR